MAVTEHFEKLNEGMEAWNEWRRQNSGVKPDLSGEKLPDKLAGIDFSGVNLARSNLQGSDAKGSDLQGADLSRAVLINADFSEAKLEGADLEGAEMGRANLSEADLTGAILRKAALDGAFLNGAVLREAVLQDTDLSKVNGLRSEQLAGTNLSGAKLPPAIGKFDALGIVDETSRNAKRLFTSLLFGCVYALLTVATTTDVRLVTNSASSPLPIIGTAIPIAHFYWAAPFILMCLYVYFLLYLQRLWESLGRLPAVFPDGTSLDKKAYPWLLNGLIRSHVALLKEDRPEFSRSQTALSVFLAYWAVPLTLVFLWGRYLFRHEWVGTGVHVALLVLSIGIAITLHTKAASTLRGGARKSVLRQKGTYLALFGILSMASGLIWFSELAISGKEVSFRADLMEQDVSTKPPSWTGQKEKETEEIALVKPARLRGANLRGANAFRAFLVRADLRRADLSRAYLLMADLREADFTRADLHEANFPFVDLSRANLALADLHEADLSQADLRDAKLNGADLRGAKLNGADLRDAKLNGADLRGAKPSGGKRSFS